MLWALLAASVAVSFTPSPVFRKKMVGDPHLQLLPMDTESRQSLHLGGCLLSVLIFSIAHALNKPLPSLLDKPAWADDVITAGILQTDATYAEVAKAGAVVLVWSVLPGERGDIKYLFFCY